MKFLVLAVLALATACTPLPPQPARFDAYQGLLPGNAQPSFDGALCDHGWGIRGRLDTFGNDPDSGFRSFRVGLKA